jgi:FkbH-like protein
MNNQQFRCVLISDFNIDIFSGYLSNDEGFPLVETIVAPFGQVEQILIQEDIDCWKGDPHCALIWTRPEAVIHSFNALLAHKTPSLKTILSEVDRFAHLLLNVCNRVPFVFLPTWTLPSFNRGFGILDMKKDIGIANTLMHMNLQLAEVFTKSSNIYLMDAQRWVNTAGKYAFNPRLWYRGKIAFGNDVYKEAVQDLKAALRGVKGHTKKLIILDLDNTLWGGVVGDLGWENLVLGGHDPAGEAYADFQSALKSLTNRGILLGIVSKNEESVALEAISKHPEMVLTLQDFAGYRINWNDKSKNIVDLVSDINLDLQSVVFIDDNPWERARVRETLPEVFVPEWSDDSMLYKSTLLNLRCFDTPSVSKEDTERTKMYLSEQKRKGLEIKINVEKICDANLQRTVQLFNKTNQMNLRTRRMSNTELADWANMDGHNLWTFRVSDKMGDSGLTGIISLEVKNKQGLITDFILSCRVIGRKVEETMLFTVIQYARTLGLDELVAEYIPTLKNKPCLEFWKKSGFRFYENNSTFIWELKNEFPLPDYIEIIQTETDDNRILRYSECRIENEGNSKKICV